MIDSTIECRTRGEHSIPSHGSDVTSPAETYIVVNGKDPSYLQNFVLLYDKKRFLSGCKEPTLRFASRNCSKGKIKIFKLTLGLHCHKFDYNNKFNEK